MLEGPHSARVGRVLAERIEWLSQPVAGRGRAPVVLAERLLADARTLGAPAAVRARDPTWLLPLGRARGRLSRRGRWEWAIARYRFDRLRLCTVAVADWVDPIAGSSVEQWPDSDYIIVVLGHLRDQLRVHYSPSPDSEIPLSTLHNAVVVVERAEDLLGDPIYDWKDWDRRSIGAGDFDVVLPTIEHLCRLLDQLDAIAVQQATLAELRELPPAALDSTGEAAVQADQVDLDRQELAIRSAGLDAAAAFLTARRQDH